MKINSIFYVAIGVLVLGGLFFAFKPKTSEPNPQTTISSQPSEKISQTIVATETVALKADAFEPEILIIQKGTKVVFKNEDIRAHWPASNIHPTHGIYPEFDPKQGVESGKEWAFVFDKVGRWKYHDHLAPSTRGEIKVVESAEELNKLMQNTYELVIKDKEIVSGSSTIKVNQNDEVTIKITADEEEEFHVHAYDKSVDIEPGKQVTLTFTANLSGRFPFELEHSKTELGALEVQPK